MSWSAGEDSRRSSSSYVHHISDVPHRTSPTLRHQHVLSSRNVSSFIGPCDLCRYDSLLSNDGIVEEDVQIPRKNGQTGNLTVDCAGPTAVMHRSLSQRVRCGPASRRDQGSGKALTTSSTIVMEGNG